MKNVLFVIIAMLFGNLAIAQNLDELFEKYADEKDCAVIYVTQSMMSLFQNIEKELESEDVEDFKELIASLENIKILNLKNDDLMQEYNEDLQGIFEDENFEELMRIRENDTDVRIMMQKNGDIINELVISAFDDGKKALVKIKGNITMEQLSQIHKRLDIEGLQHLKKVDDKKK